MNATISALPRVLDAATVDVAGRPEAMDGSISAISAARSRDHGRQSRMRTRNVDRLLRSPSTRSRRQPGISQQRGHRDESAPRAAVSPPLALPEPDERHGRGLPRLRPHHPRRQGHLRQAHGSGGPARPGRHGVPEAEPLPESIYDNVAYGPRIPRHRGRGVPELRRDRRRQSCAAPASGTEGRTAWTSPARVCPAGSSNASASRAHPGVRRR